MTSKKKRKVRKGGTNERDITCVAGPTGSVPRGIVFEERKLGVVVIQSVVPFSQLHVPWKESNNVGTKMKLHNIINAVLINEDLLFRCEATCPSEGKELSILLAECFHPLAWDTPLDDRNA